MNKLKQVKYFQKLIFISLTFTITNAWAESYQRCSEAEIESLVKKYQLAHQSVNDTNNVLSDCLIINHKSKLFFIAVSNPLNTQSDNAGNYDLNLFIIDNKQQKIIQKYRQKDPIVPITHLESIKFDTNPFSTLPNQNVVGLAIHEQHIGGISHDSRTLNLYKITNHFEIKPILLNFLTDFSSGMAPMGCDDAKTSTLKRNLILLNTTSHGLQDIQINEKTDNTQVSTSCTVSYPIQRQKHILKFNGQKYPTNKIKFLKYGI